MNKREMVQEIIDHLTELGWREREPDDYECGVCYELDHNLPFVGLELEMDSFNQQWKHYSGELFYPIKGDPRFQDGDAWSSYHSEKMAKWADTKYGNYRRQYCLDMAEWFEDNIEEICQ